MPITPLSHQLGRRLEEIDRQIHTCLRDIRRNMSELEHASKRPDTPATGDTFADMLGDAMEGDSRDGGPTRGAKS